MAAALSAEIKASAVRQVDGHLRAQAKAERDIARNLRDRNCGDLAAMHDRMAELYDAAAQYVQSGRASR
jgi:hypothetical protein